LKFGQHEEKPSNIRLIRDYFQIAQVLRLVHLEGAAMWMYIGMAFGLAAPISLGLFSWLTERNQDIVLSPKIWNINPDWPKSKRLCAGICKAA
jgi:hypothetical protein